MNIAAFFDVDGTLVAPPSLERRFLRYLRWRGEVGIRNYRRWLGELLRVTRRQGARATGGWGAWIQQNKAYLAGVPTAAMNQWLAWLARHPVALVPEVLGRIGWHVQRGHRIFLLSGTLAPLARAVAQRIAVPVDVGATQLEQEQGRFTGHVLGEVMSGAGKARAMQHIAAEYSLDLVHSYAYGDGYCDRWMLGSVGNPFVVQTTNRSSWRLERLARQRNWRVLRWSETAQESRNPYHRDAEATEKSREKQDIIAVQVKCR